MKKVILLITIIAFAQFSDVRSGNVPFNLEVEQVSIPGAPAIHSFAFAQSGGKWMFIGGRTNGLHGFTTSTAFPKEFSNRKIYVVDPSTGMTYSRDIFLDLPFWSADQFRSTNMQYIQSGDKLYFIGGYGYDSTSNNFVTFPFLKVIDVQATIDAVMNGNPISSHVRELSDERLRVTGGEVINLEEYFYLAGGHRFMGPYRRNLNNQTYTNRIKKFRINDDGVSVSISDYSEAIDTVEFHRRDMNLVPAIQADGIGSYAILYGGVFKTNIDLPFVNPIYIEPSGNTVDYSFEQKMTQYTSAYMGVFDANDGSMHTTLFAGTSLYSLNDSTGMLEIDSLVPFINDITTLSRRSDGSTEETIMNERFNNLVGTNAKFILNRNVPAFANGVIKLRQLTGRTLVGHIYGGIKAQLPNNGPTTPSDIIYEVYITPEMPLPVELAEFYSRVEERKVTLNWTTAGETNNSGFEIQRMKEGEEGVWKSAGFVQGGGTISESRSYAFEENSLPTGNYNYRLKQIDFNGNFEYHMLSGDVVIGLPTALKLHQNYPNPFNPETKINYDIPYNGKAVLKIFDIRGAEVAEILNSEITAGYYTAGIGLGMTSSLSSGVYYAVLTLSPVSGQNEMRESVRMILLK